MPDRPSRAVDWAAQGGLALAVLVAAIQWWVVSVDEALIDRTYSGIQGTELTRELAAAIDQRRLQWSAAALLSLALAAYLFVRWIKEVTNSGLVARHLTAAERRQLGRIWFIPWTGQVRSYPLLRRLERATRNAGDELCDPLDTDRQSAIVLRAWWLAFLAWTASFLMELVLLRRASGWFDGTSMWAIRMSLDTALVRCMFTVLAGIPLTLFVRWVGRTLAQ